MDKYPVTCADYIRVMREYPREYNRGPQWPNYGNNVPVTKIGYWTAKAYCDKIGKRLPTEAEWEYACRAGTNTKYYWGDSFDGDFAWDEGNSKNRSHEVGKKKPNQWGLFDMCGNIFEWCEDMYDENYYSISPNRNPKGFQSRYGANDNCQRIKRGGSFQYGADSLHCSSRSWGFPEDIEYDTGFRCVR